MPSKDKSPLERVGAALWTRRLALLILGAITGCNLAVMTFAWSHHPKAGGGGILAVFWILSLGAFFALFRLWQAPSQGSAAPAGSPGGNAGPSNRRVERP